MIIDKILDRKDGAPYNPKQFYNEVMEWGELGHDIADALDGGENEDVQKALCDYIMDNEYNPDICNYIKENNWTL